MKSATEWFEEAKVPEELLQNGHGAGRDLGWLVGTPLKGVPNQTFPGGISVGDRLGELVLGKNEEGDVEIPPHVRLAQVLKLCELPEPPPREYLLEGLIPEGAATSLYGDGGVAKSLLAMSLCCSVAKGDGSWMGRASQHAACLYMDFELTADEQMRRFSALCRGAGYEDVPSEMYYLSAVGLSSDEAFLSAFKACDDFGVKLLVVDSFGPAMHGEAESATDVLSFFRRRIEPFVAEGIAVLMVDHQAKGTDAYQRKSTFGSVYKRNLVRSQVQVEAMYQDQDTGTLELLFRHNKHNFGALAKPFGAELGFRDGEIRVGPMDLEPATMARQEHFTNEERVLLALADADESMAITRISDETDMAVKSVTSAITKLKRKGKVRFASGNGRNETVELVEQGSPVTYVDRTYREEV